MMTKKKQKIDFRVICVGMVCVTILEVVALLKGIDGILLTAVIATIAAAIGVTLPQVKIK